MPRRELDVSGLPSVVFGNRSMIWWGTAGMMLIEGTMFAITVGAYFFLRTRSTDWPPGLLPPKLTWGTANLIVFVLSAAPAYWTQKVAEKGDLQKTRIGLIVMSTIGVINIVIRFFEFPALMCTWDANAYASAVWTLLGLHTVHIITDWFDTVVLTALFFTSHVEGRRYMDTSENSDYWYFVVLTWVPIYAVIYLASRWL
jgi:cytochrome c oxidase subunit I+III